MEVFLLRRSVALHLYLSVQAYNARQALELADGKTSRYYDAMNYVVGIITLATPFGGSSAAKVAILRTRFARCLGSSSSDKLIKVVKEHNPGIDDHAQRFCQVIQGRSTLVQYYYETQETNLLGKDVPLKGC